MVRNATRQIQFKKAFPDSIPCRKSLRQTQESIPKIKNITFESTYMQDYAGETFTCSNTHL